MGTNIATVIAAPVNTSLGCTPGFELGAGDRYFQPTNSPYAFGAERATPWSLIEVHPALQNRNLAARASDPMPSVMNIAGAVPNSTPTPLLPHQIHATYVLFQPWLYTQADPAATVQLPQENAAALTFYKYVSPTEGGPQAVKNPLDPYGAYEPPIATLVPGKPQNWIIQNSTQEWHVFHLHQVHFQVDHFTVVPFPFDPTADPTRTTTRPLHSFQHAFYSQELPPPSGKQSGDPLYVGFTDTVSIPPMMQVWIHIPMTEGTHGDDPIAGHMVMHCHILNHEDAGMMANVQATDQRGIVAAGAGAVKSSFAHSLPPVELPKVRTDHPLHLADTAGQVHNAQLFTKSEFSLVTFGFTHCDGACPLTMEKCRGVLAQLPVKDRSRIAPYFISLDPERDDRKALTAYVVDHNLPGTWSVLADTDLQGMRAFGVRRNVRHLASGGRQIWHTSTVYVVDRNLEIRAAFDPEDSSKEMIRQLTKLLAKS